MLVFDQLTQSIPPFWKKKKNVSTPKRYHSLSFLGFPGLEEFGKASFQRDINELKLAANYNSRTGKLGVL